ncbi:hypothetical protein ABZY05_46740 [Streptomyces canus]|uniref:hypothetical protein n=1 Tax=Streptomyces canus TaxID=58343 RepID=UPI0033A79754
MAKCCGVQPCSCRVVAGTGTTVTGNGSAANPYTVSADGAGTTALAVTDTPTVDLTLAGTGAAGDPYAVAADVILDPTPPQGGTNLIGSGPEGLFVECADVRTCFTAGDGIDYDQTTGEIAADISGDAGNQTTIGTDGGIYTAAAATALEASDTQTVDVTVTGTGTAADPFQVAAGVILDPTPPQGGTNLIGSGPEGLFVECADVRTCFTAGDGIDYDQSTGEIAAKVSTDAGNVVTFGTDGGLYAPTSGGGGTVVQAGDTPTANNTVTGTGSPGDPYIVSTDVILDPAPPGGGSNLLQESPDGLFVECADVRGCFTAGDGIAYDQATGEIAADISGDAGNQTTIGTDGGIYTPATPTAVEAVDTPTVDVTVTGTGAAGDPYQVAASVILDPAPPGGGSNLLQESPDGLFVECADVRTCFTAGDGIAYDQATGEIAAKISTDAGNQTTFGTDGGIYTPAAAGTALQAADTPTLNATVTGTGTPGDPYVVSGDVIVAPEDNGVEISPSGLLVAPSSDAGNRLAFGTDDRLYVPPTEVGCGLQGDGSAGSPIEAFPIAGDRSWDAHDRRHRLHPRRLDRLRRRHLHRRQPQPMPWRLVLHPVHRTRRTDLAGERPVGSGLRGADQRRRPGRTADPQRPRQRPGPPRAVLVRYFSGGRAAPAHRLRGARLPGDPRTGRHRDDQPVDHRHRLAWDHPIGARHELLRERQRGLALGQR